MSELKIVQKSTIKNIGIENEDGELIHTLKIDVSDAGTVERFANLSKNLNHTVDDFQKEASDLVKKYAGTEETDDQVVEASRVHVAYINRCIAELDSVFGEGTVKAILKANYDNNPDYVPDEIELYNFLESVMPIMGQLFGDRMDACMKKFNVNRKGRRKK